MGSKASTSLKTKNFQIIMPPTANRAWRFLFAQADISDKRKNVTVVGYEDAQRIFQLLTPHASDMLDRRSVPFYKLPIHNTTGYT